MELEEVLQYMKEKHKGQTRKDGKTPYEIHPIEVAKILERYGASKEIQAIGLLHDILEDTNGTYEEIKGLIGEEGAKIVTILTKEKGYKEEDYIQRIAENEKAKIVKLADRIHNLKDSIHASIPFQKRYIQETKNYYLELAKGSNMELEFNEAFTRVKENIEKWEKEQDEGRSKK